MILSLMLVVLLVLLTANTVILLSVVSSIAVLKASVAELAKAIVKLVTATMPEEPKPSFPFPHLEPHMWIFPQSKP